MGSAFLAEEEAVAVEPQLRDAIRSSDGRGTRQSTMLDTMLHAMTGFESPSGVAVRSRRCTFVEEVAQARGGATFADSPPYSTRTARPAERAIHRLPL